MKNSIKKSLILTLVATSLTLSACNSGGGSSPQANHSSEVTTAWIPVGKNTPDFSQSNSGLVYDKETNQFFGMVLEHGFKDNYYICSIQESASPTSNWNCNIFISEGYRPLQRNMLTDNNGHLLIYASGSNDDNKYVLTYDIKSGNWDYENPLSITSDNTVVLLYLMPLASVYYDNTLIGQTEDNSLAKVNLTTGVMTVESGFYNPSPNGIVKQSINNNNLYYNVSDQIYTKTVSSGVNVASRVGMTLGGGVFALNADNTSLYACTNKSVSFIGLNVPDTTAWNLLPPTSVYTEYVNGSAVMQETTGCRDIIPVNGTLFAYAAIYESSVNGSPPTTHMQLLKY